MAWVEAKTVFGRPPETTGRFHGDLASEPTEVDRRPLGARHAEGVVDFDDDETAPYLAFDWEPTDVRPSSPR